MERTQANELRVWKGLAVLYFCISIVAVVLLIDRTRDAVLGVTAAFVAGIESDHESLCDMLDLPSVDGYCLAGEGVVVEDWSCPFGKLRVSSDEPASLGTRFRSWFLVGCVLEAS